MRANLPTGCILSKFYIKPQLVRLLEFGVRRCILSKFYIKPQLNLSILQALQVVSYRNSTSNHNGNHYSAVLNGLYLIEILHQTTTLFRNFVWRISCILSKFYIKPQRLCKLLSSSFRCILSKFYIKPQQFVEACRVRLVVSYRNSTSNHNRESVTRLDTPVVSYRNSTSNHNSVLHSFSNLSLYLIEILHQTTTESSNQLEPQGLYLIEILHQTTTKRVANSLDRGCILSKFYIKPQLLVMYSCHDTCCILSKFYIKPQLHWRFKDGLKVVSYRNSTSNHNPI